VGAGLCALSSGGFASLAILVKVVYAQGMRLTEILFLRFAGAALLLGLYLAITRWKTAFPGPRKALQLLALGAVGYAVQSTLYVGALQRVPASICALLLYIYPVYVALLTWAIHRRPPARREWVAMVLAFIGVALTVSPGLNPASGQAARLDRLGVTLVMAASVWYAGYILICDQWIRQVGSLISTGWIVAGSGLSFAASAWITNGTLAPRLSPTAALAMLGMIVFSTILPMGTFLAGLARVGPTTASLLSTLEPVFTVILAAVFLREALSAVQLAGGGFVLTALILLNLPDRRDGTRGATDAS
jgi:drug/metabolite transporter (DMT)-like permease